MGRMFIVHADSFEFLIMYSASICKTYVPARLHFTVFSVCFKLGQFMQNKISINLKYVKWHLILICFFPFIHHVALKMRIAVHNWYTQTKMLVPIMKCMPAVNY